MGKLFVALSNLAAAEKHFPEALDYRKRFLGIQESLVGVDGDALVPTLEDLAALLYATGSGAEAELLIRRATAIEERIHGRASQEVAEIPFDFGNKLEKIGLMGIAEQNYIRALTSLRGRPEYVDSTLYALARLYANNGQLDKAEVAIKRSLPLQKRYNASDWAAHATYLQYASILYRRGRFRDAMAVWDGHIAYLENVRREQPATYAEVRRIRGYIFTEYGDYSAARAEVLQLIAFERAFSKDQLGLSYDLGTLSVCEARLGDSLAAAKSAQEALEIIVTLRTRNQAINSALSSVSETFLELWDLGSMVRLASQMDNEGTGSAADRFNRLLVLASKSVLESQNESADRQYLELIAESRKERGTDAWIPRLLLQRANLLTGQDRLSEAAALLKECLRIEMNCLPRDCAAIRETKHRLERLSRKQK